MSRMADLAVELDEFSPDDRCADCGIAVENDHYTCQGHQFCMPECPRCGGRLIPIDRMRFDPATGHWVPDAVREAGGEL